MDFFKWNNLNNIYSSVKRLINEFQNTITTLLLITPLLYSNLICTNICISYTINNVYLCYLYSQKEERINNLLNLTNLNDRPYRYIMIGLIYTSPLLYNFYINNDILQSIRITSIYTYYIYERLDDIKKYILNVVLNIILDIILTCKIFLINYYKGFINYNFILIKVELYTNLKDKIDVTPYFKQYFNNNINNTTSTNKHIDKKIIDDLYIKNNIESDKNSDTRLKIYFKYQQIDYIIYFPYEIINSHLNDINEYYLPYPIYDNKIMEDFRKDIVLPYYNETKQNGNKKFYSLFHIESKDILLTCINNDDDHSEELKNYFNLIKTPFNDFGLLYNVPVKLDWILNENNIEIKDFNYLYLKYLNMYFCEIEFDIKSHIIKMDSNDLNKIFISDRMKQILYSK